MSCAVPKARSFVRGDKNLRLRKVCHSKAAFCACNKTSFRCGNQYDIRPTEAKFHFCQANENSA